MEEPRRRARFQIHLSTAIVLMFVAGGMIWANVRIHRVDLFSEMGKEGEKPLEFKMTQTHIYFPDGSDAEIPQRDELRIFFGYQVISYGLPWEALNFKRYGSFGEGGIETYVDVGTKNWAIRGIILDSLTAMGILFVVWFLCEWLIRRRSARKGA